MLAPEVKSTRSYFNAYQVEFVDGHWVMLRGDGEVLRSHPEVTERQIGLAMTSQIAAGQRLDLRDPE
ncbi:hypothetical protein NVP2117O_78 [Vibrio phage 2.117.O._10N.261.45.E9]|nr:hypothetical protein NVP1117O_78 [Vibrio phage 1.117.O._10N.261.45.E9]AUR95479.1 hypothetical protein NVP1207B_72 [Vibrio phage 1.207.B._10N.222.51.C2]AUS02370.1 hypothetical protein NVP2117O_78 [Vibrio phage 2.117.O._10N.261.45.E9]